MSDIVERLRNFDASKFDGWACMEEAADEIERLRSIISKDPNVVMIAYESGDHQRLGRAAGKMTNELDRLRAENDQLRAERDLWISRFEGFRKNAARLEEARSRPMRLVGSAAALKETGE